jgi:choline dehydrogenase-like flavoprotein
MAERGPGRLLPKWSRRSVDRFCRVACDLEGSPPNALDGLKSQIGAHLAALPWHLRAVLVGGFLLFNQAARLRRSSFPRAFSALSPPAAEAYFQAMSQSGKTWQRDLTKFLRTLVLTNHYDLPEVRERVGYRPDPYIEEIARRRRRQYAKDIQAADDLVLDGPSRNDRVGKKPGDWQARVVEPVDLHGDVTIDCDVVVVGSGAGGATMAAELADAGLDVVIVEEGDWRPTPTFTTSVTGALQTLYRDAGLQAAIGTPPIVLSEGRCAGGSTVINGAMSWPTPKHVLEEWSRNAELSGISPEQLEPYFIRAERRLHVEYQDEKSVGRDSHKLKKGANALGWEIIPNRRAQVHCAGCNMCTLGCPTTAKRSMLVTNIPRALSRGARLYTGCRVKRITKVDQRATGVIATVRTPAGEPPSSLYVRSRIVVVACGALQTPALLRRSGFRSPSKELGRNLTLHPNAKVVALFDEDVEGWKGAHQAFQVRQFMKDGIIISVVNLPPSLLAAGLPYHGRRLTDFMGDYNRVVVAGCLIEDSTTGSVVTLPGVGPVTRYQITDQDLHRIVRGVMLTAEVMFEAGAQRVLLPFDGVDPLERRGHPNGLGLERVQKRDVELLSIHLMGTARMSDDMTRGVVSSFGQFHGADGLVVADASVLPGPVGLNPMESVMALALRSADFLIDNY